MQMTISMDKSWNIGGRRITESDTPKPIQCINEQTLTLISCHHFCLKWLQQWYNVKRTNIDGILRNTYIKRTNNMQCASYKNVLYNQPTISFTTSPITNSQFITNNFRVSQQHLTDKPRYLLLCAFKHLSTEGLPQSRVRYPEWKIELDSSGPNN